MISRIALRKFTICDSRVTLSSPAQFGPLCSEDRLRRPPLSPALPCKALAPGTLDATRLYLWFVLWYVISPGLSRGNFNFFNFPVQYQTAAALMGSHAGRFSARSYPAAALISLFSSALPRDVPCSPPPGYP